MPALFVRGEPRVTLIVYTYRSCNAAGKQLGLNGVEHAQDVPAGAVVRHLPIQFVGLHYRIGLIVSQIPLDYGARIHGLLAYLERILPDGGGPLGKHYLHRGDVVYNVVFCALLLAVTARHDAKADGLLCHEFNSVQRRILIWGAFQQLCERGAETETYKSHGLVRLRRKNLAIQRYRFGILRAGFGEILLTRGIVQIVGELLDWSNAHRNLHLRMTVPCAHGISESSCGSAFLVATHGEQGRLPVIYRTQGQRQRQGIVYIVAHVSFNYQPRHRRCRLLPWRAAYACEHRQD